MEFIRKLIYSEKSQGLVEYAYIAALLSIFYIALMIVYRDTLMQQTT